MRWTTALIALLTTLAVASGCQSGAGNGALIGGATGAGLGGLIGSYSHARAGEGALIGGAIGAATGALIGDSVEQEQRTSSYRERYDDSGHSRTSYVYEDAQPRYYTTSYREVYVTPCPPPPPYGYVEVRTYHRPRYYRYCR
jgi:uncharacterized protein YcfJ